MIRKDNGAGPILGTSMLTLRLALRHQNLAKGSVLLVCCRCISPTVREGSVAIRAGALPHGRASAPFVPSQHNAETSPLLEFICSGRGPFNRISATYGQKDSSQAKGKSCASSERFRKEFGGGVGV